jgi:DNA mismatch repair protein MutS
MYRGQGVFAVEMSELRTILLRSNERSLVLGDEICHCTEQNSGLAIVASSIVSLAKKKTNFIFATHLHKLPDLPEIKALDNVSRMHLEVRYDEGRDILIYNRKLKKGKGIATYGIEVAKAMGINHEVVKLAEVIRRRELGISQEFMSTRKSHFNAKVYMDTCAICGSSVEETHHIKEQHTADERGYVGHYHKNHESNLIPLCKACHLEEHHGNLEIHGWKLTSEGFILDFERK